MKKNLFKVLNSIIYLWHYYDMAYLFEKSFSNNVSFYLLQDFNTTKVFLKDVPTMLLGFPWEMIIIILLITILIYMI